MTTVLMLVTGADHWTLADGTRQPSGFWAEEALGPYQVFTEAGYDIVVATPDGVVPTPDALSLSADFNGGEEGARRMREALDAATELREPIAVADVDPKDYDIVFVPGGWGPMEDLAVDPQSGALLTSFFETGRPLALVCHGPAALLATIDADGDSPFDGYSLTGLANSEERANGLADRAKWLLQDRLISDLHADYSEVAPFEPHVVVDRNLFTGQNPGSATPLAQRVVEEIS
ncbi:type 1 glutamine amidotransferase domain-containing protein [Actinomyces viscosus]|uniref:type 1 glutamine amidotransferase domain-containing protein n=1 Tax=Actinomyces viscosus TaxID=1656 RepID=UPI0028F05469|nr:type 1 glutamine amidotransferase domain-containing protein [Actinomyces viscosus]